MLTNNAHSLRRAGRKNQTTSVQGIRMIPLMGTFIILVSCYGALLHRHVQAAGVANGRGLVSAVHADHSADCTNQDLHILADRLIACVLQV